MAGLVDPTTQRGPQAIDAPHPPRRSFNSRLSLGHVIMIVAGLSAFLLVFSILRNRDQTFEIATAAIELRAGTTVNHDAFSFSSIGVPDRSVLGTFLSPEQVERSINEGWVVTRTVSAGDPVRMTDFRIEADPSELRAMSIPIDRGHAVAGVLQAGDIVDVIVVRKGVAGYVATGVEVVDVAGGDNQFAGGFSVTVAIDGPASLRLASAVRDGGLEIVRATGATQVDPHEFYDPSQQSLPVLPDGQDSPPPDVGTG
ncbi:MAG: hypothetical protein OEM81_01470 [Acidimicrobiia bacterium]|nr:hypothetical protein [Acidimicrobiia bacterium]